MDLDFRKLFKIKVEFEEDAPKTEEDNYENSVVYACGFILSWITLLIILIAILEVKNNKKK